MKISKYFILMMGILLSACGSPTETILPSQTEETTQNPGTQNLNIQDLNLGSTTDPVTANFGTGYDYVNQLRQSAGMIRLAKNTLLAQAAKNHANYLLSHNIITHDETKTLSGFTGRSPADRANAVNYRSTSIKEGIATESSTNAAIDGLFSAIYHRFTLMTSEFDEIGISFVQDPSSAQPGILVHNMGNSLLNALCITSPPNHAGKFYGNTCKNPDIKIAVNDYDRQRQIIRQSNPALILWPPENGSDIPPAFFEEIPDPLPNHSVSGYPISIEFNGGLVNDVSINLFHATTNNTINNTILLDEFNDPNEIFSSQQFTLFPLERLDWNTTYRVEASYRLDDTDQSTTWTFQTQSPAKIIKTVATTDTTFTLPTNVAVAIYLVPNSPVDTIKAVALNRPTTTSIRSQFIDNNTLLITATGTAGQIIRFTFNKGTSPNPRVLTATLE